MIMISQPSKTGFAHSYLSYMDRGGSHRPRRLGRQECCAESAFNVGRPGGSEGRCRGNVQVAGDRGRTFCCSQRAHETRSLNFTSGIIY
jgi:hypothetical protein